MRSLSWLDIALVLLAQLFKKLGATVDKRLERWVVMRAPSGQRFCIVRVQRDGFDKDANIWS